VLASNDRARLLPVLAGLAGLALAGLLTPAAAAAVTRGPHWVQATPSGGSIVALERAPSSSLTLYALADNGDLFQTTDGAVTWSRRESRRFNAAISGLAVDPTDAKTAYAVAYSQDNPSLHLLLRTRDGGRSWMPLGFTSSIWALHFDPVHPRVLYGTGRGLQRSVDGGQSWTPVGFGALPVFSLAIDPFDGQTLLAAVGGNDVGVPVVVWRSRDRGLSWQSTPLAAPPGGLNYYVPYLVFDESRRDTAYAFMVFQILGTVSPGAVYRSRDGGRSWSPLPAATGILDLATSPDGRLYAAAANLGVAHSDDAGETWQPPFDDPNTAHSVPQDAIGRVVVAAGSPETLFAAGTVGVGKSTTKGEQWEISSRGIVALEAFSILTSPVAPSIVLAVAGHGLFASHDQGQDWELLSTDSQLTQPYRLLAFDPRDPRTVYGVGFDGQFDFLTKSVDGGRSWRQILYPYGCSDSTCSASIGVFALDPSRPDTMVVSTSYFGAHGFGGGSFLLRSDDGGETWSSLSPPDGMGGAVTFAPTHPSLLYGLGCGRLFASQDSGTTWYSLGGGGLPCFSQELVLDPQEPRILYVGTDGAGVYRSSDGGATFRPFGHGLESATVTTLIVDPTSSANVYAGVAGQGVWRWNPGSRQWTPLNAGFPVGDFSGALALDPQHPAALYVGTMGHGVLRLLLPDRP